LDLEVPMMRPSRRILGSFVLASVVAIVLAASTLASSSFTYKLSGFEIAATSTVGTFVGVGTTAHDAGTWSASITHTVLNDRSATINSGTFAYDGTVRDIAGTFNPGGTLSQTSGFSGCTNQTYAVTGSLVLTAPTSGTGTFSAVLTHYRIRLFGQCIVYSATVKGGATFTFN
jgi:hypothetical protein